LVLLFTRHAFVLTWHSTGYIAEISIGTPSQTFKMLIDISYGDTWVPSTCVTLESHAG